MTETTWRAIGTAAIGLLGLLVLQVVYKIAGKISSTAHKSINERAKRIKTLWQVGRNAGYILILVSVIMMILSELGVDITPVLASAGVAGLALSLGAQTLIKDLLGGLFILSENQFYVGDVITIGNLSGTVEEIRLRATYLRDLEGRLHMIPNGDIRTVTNQTTNWSQVQITLNVDYDADMEQVQQALISASSALQNHPEVGQHLAGCSTGLSLDWGLPIGPCRSRCWQNQAASSGRDGNYAGSRTGKRSSRKASGCGTNPTGGTGESSSRWNDCCTRNQKSPPNTVISFDRRNTLLQFLERVVGRIGARFRCARSFTHPYTDAAMGAAVTANTWRLSGR